MLAEIGMGGAVQAWLDEPWSLSLKKPNSTPVSTLAIFPNLPIFNPHQPYEILGFSMGFFHGFPHGNPSPPRFPSWPPCSAASTPWMRRGHMSYWGSWRAPRLRRRCGWRNVTWWFIPVTLWWTYKKQWKMAIYSGFSHEQWWFSIAMLVHQRVVSGFKPQL